ncbi:MAG TPA: TonB-dependent receptor [Spongiibacteraceae bacterium]|nr:TonB-dependent receptor [Spongiibacteraceae bacterium]
MKSSSRYFALNPIALAILTLTASMNSEAAEDNRSTSVDEVIVTAQKHEESLQQTPIAISAFSTVALEERGIVQTQDVALFTPNMTAAVQPASSGTASYAIRGIAQTEPVMTVDPAVGVYMNGVYMARNNGLAFDVVDVERIEVLRGPQGTLYGRNSMSGAVNIVTAQPKGTFAFKQQLTTGSRDLFKSRTTIDTPEVAGISSKISYLYTKQNGYVNNVTTNSQTGDHEDFGAKKDQGFNLALKWQASDAVTFDYNYDQTRNRDMPAAFQLTKVTPGFVLGSNANRAGGAYPLGVNSNNGGFGDTVLLGTYASFGNTPAAGQCSLDPGCVSFANTPNAAFGGATAAQALLGPLDAAYANGAANVKANVRVNSLSLPYQGIESLDIKGHSLTSTWDIDEELQVKSITAYRKLTDQQYTDLSGGGSVDLTAVGGGIVSLFANNGLDQSQNQFSQELQIVGVQDHMDWVAGVYFFREHVESSTGQTVAPTYGAFDSSSYEATNYAKAIYGQATYTPASIDALHLTLGLRSTSDKRELSLDDSSGATGDFSHSYHNASGGATVAYDLTPDMNTYAKYSRGYTSGGFNARTSVANQKPFNPEFVNAYEVGYKAQLFDHRMTFNAAGFINKFTALQLSQFVPSSAGAETVVSNVGKATMQGVEIEITAIPVEGLTLDLNYGLIDMRYDQYLFSSPATNFQPVDVSNAAHFPTASKQSISLGMQYDFLPFSWGSLSARLDTVYNSGYKHDTLDTSFDKYTESGAFTLVNGRLSLSQIAVGSGNLEFSAWGKNLFDKEYRTYGIGSFGAPLGFAGAVYNEPRSFGLDATYRYE